MIIIIIILTITINNYDGNNCNILNVASFMDKIKYGLMGFI